QTCALPIFGSQLDDFNRTVDQCCFGLCVSGISRNIELRTQYVYGLSVADDFERYVFSSGTLWLHVKIILTFQLDYTFFGCKLRGISQCTVGVQPDLSTIRQNDPVVSANGCF